MIEKSMLDPSQLDYSLHYRAFHDETPEHAAMMAEYHRKMIQAYLPKASELPVLDIGCGMGFALQALIGVGFPEAIGIDIDRGQIESCRRRGFTAEQISDSAAYLRARPETFELITLLDVLEHVPVAGQIPLMQAVHTALRPGGRVIVQVPNANAALAARWRYIDFTHTSSFTEHSLAFVFRAAGFERFDIPGDGVLGRPPVKLWTRVARQGLRRWLVRWMWRQVLLAHLEGVDIRTIPIGLNMIGIGYKLGGVDS